MLKCEGVLISEFKHMFLKARKHSKYYDVIVFQPDDCVLSTLIDWTLQMRTSAEVACTGAVAMLFAITQRGATPVHACLAMLAVASTVKV